MIRCVCAREFEECNYLTYLQNTRLGEDAVCLSLLAGIYKPNLVTEGCIVPKKSRKA